MRFVTACMMSGVECGKRPGHCWCKTVFATGESIVNRTAKTTIGMRMLEYGGGGHGNAGICQGDHAMAEDVLGALI